MPKKKFASIEEYARHFASLGGKARMAKMTPEERQAFASKGGKVGSTAGGAARAASLTPRKRSEIAKKAAAARWKRASQDGQPQ